MYKVKVEFSDNMNNSYIFHRKRLLFVFLSLSPLDKNKPNISHLDKNKPNISPLDKNKPKKNPTTVTMSDIIVSLIIQFETVFCRIFL